MNLVLKFCLLSILFFSETKKERVVMSKSYPIEKTTLRCGSSETGLIFVFLKEKRNNCSDSLIFGLVRCPELGKAQNLQYNHSYLIKYRKLKHSDTVNVIVLNQLSFKGKNLYLIESIE